MEITFEVAGLQIYERNGSFALDGKLKLGDSFGMNSIKGESLTCQSCTLLSNLQVGQHF